MNPNAQPEPALCGGAQSGIIKNEDAIDPHAALRAEYAKQVAEETTGFYLWECNLNAGKAIPAVWCLDPPLFRQGGEYRFTDISCMVSKDGEPAIRMTRQDGRRLMNTKSQNAFEAYIICGVFGENTAVRLSELTWYEEKYSADIARDFKLWQAAEAYGREQATKALDDRGIADLVNQLTATAKEFGWHGSVRQRISGLVLAALGGRAIDAAIAGELK
jgi:hypothetical protein